MLSEKQNSARAAPILAFGTRTRRGGGVRLALKLVRCKFHASAADGFGGAIATRGGVSTQAERCVFAANTDYCVLQLERYGRIRP